MKLLPCRTSLPGKGRTCDFATLPGGEPYIVGNVSRFPFRYPCAGCGRQMVLSASEVARLPQLTVKRLEALGDHLPARYTKDFVGAGIEHEHACALIDAGFSSPSDPLLRGRA